MSVDITVAGVAYPVPSSAADTDWAADQIAWEQAVSAATVPFTYSALSLASGWAGTFQAAKDSTGRIWLRGTFGKDGAEGETITTLPSGRRPPTTVYVPAVALNGGGLSSVVMLQINTNGTINVYSGETHSVVISQIAFDTQSF